MSRLRPLEILEEAFANVKATPYLEAIGFASIPPLAETRMPTPVSRTYHGAYPRASQFSLSPGRLRFSLTPGLCIVLTK